MADGITKRGWFRPLDTKKWHYFAQSATNLCRTRMVFNLKDEDLEAGNDESVDNCATCKKRLAALRAAEDKKERSPLNDANVKLMRHALGLDEEGKGTIYRNRYNAPPYHTRRIDLATLCEAGYMVQDSADWFSVTPKGIRAVKRKGIKTRVL